MNRKFEKILKQIAKNNGVSVEKVKKEMQEALDAAYESPNIYAQGVMRKGEKPTLEEFMAHLAKKL